MAVALSEEPQDAAPAPRSDPPARRAQSAPENPPPRRYRLLWLLGGWFFFAIGFIGMFLPVLPTTGFWILAAIAFERSHPKFAKRIRNWPHVGRGVSDYIDHGVISRRGKAAALTGMVFAAALIVLFTTGVAFWFGLGGLLIGALYVASRPSKPRSL